MFSFAAKDNVLFRAACVAFAFVAVGNIHASKPVKYDTPPPGFQLSSWQRSNPPPTLEERRKLLKPVKPGELRLRPTFNSCGVAWGVPNECFGIVPVFE